MTGAGLSAAGATATPVAPTATAVPRTNTPPPAATQTATATRTAGRTATATRTATSTPASGPTQTATRTATRTPAGVPTQTATRRRPACRRILRRRRPLRPARSPVCRASSRLIISGTATSRAAGPPQLGRLHQRHRRRRRSTPTSPRVCGTVAHRYARERGAQHPTAGAHQLGHWALGQRPRPLSDSRECAPSKAGPPPAATGM